MKPLLASWQAVLSAAFAALTAIFAKIGVENVNSDFARFVRTIVILFAPALVFLATEQWQKSWFGLAPGLSVPGSVGLRHRRVVDLLFSARSSSAMPRASRRSTS